MIESIEDVAPGRQADVALDGIWADVQEWQRQHRRPASLSLRQAIKAASFEIFLITVALGNVMDGAELSADDWNRCRLAQTRIDALLGEVLR